MPNTPHTCTWSRSIHNSVCHAARRFIFPVICCILFARGVVPLVPSGGQHNFAVQLNSGVLCLDGKKQEPLYLTRGVEYWFTVTPIPAPHGRMVITNNSVGGVGSYALNTEEGVSNNACETQRGYNHLFIISPHYFRILEDPFISQVCVLTYGLDTHRVTYQTAECGDGNNIGEQCDDNNVRNGDGCSSLCKIEKGYGCVSVTTGSGTPRSQCAKCDTGAMEQMKPAHPAVRLEARVLALTGEGASGVPRQGLVKKQSIHALYAILHKVAVYAILGQDVSTVTQLEYARIVLLYALHAFASLLTVVVPVVRQRKPIRRVHLCPVALGVPLLIIVDPKVTLAQPVKLRGKILAVHGKGVTIVTLKLSVSQSPTPAPYVKNRVTSFAVIPALSQIVLGVRVRRNVNLMELVELDPLVPFGVAVNTVRQNQPAEVLIIHANNAMKLEKIFALIATIVLLSRTVRGVMQSRSASLKALSVLVAIRLHLCPQSSAESKATLVVHGVHHFCCAWTKKKCTHVLHALMQMKLHAMLLQGASIVNLAWRACRMIFIIHVQPASPLNQREAAGKQILHNVEWETSGDVNGVQRKSNVTLLTAIAHNVFCATDNMCKYSASFYCDKCDSGSGDSCGGACIFPGCKWCSSMKKCERETLICPPCNMANCSSLIGCSLCESEGTCKLESITCANCSDMKYANQCGSGVYSGCSWCQAEKKCVLKGNSSLCSSCAEASISACGRTLESGGCQWCPVEEVCKESDSFTCSDCKYANSSSCGVSPFSGCMWCPSVIAHEVLFQAATFVPLKGHVKKRIFLAGIARELQIMMNACSFRAAQTRHCGAHPKRYAGTPLSRVWIAVVRIHPPAHLADSWGAKNVSPLRNAMIQLHYAQNAGAAGAEVLKSVRILYLCAKTVASHLVILPCVGIQAPVFLAACSVTQICNALN
ncbi:hypothetical protein Pelo_12956 [Pelomyxa schiedti]|nr:hypothetical protein Pelo_12956 [Pelomyxa schiedti]